MRFIEFADPEACSLTARDVADLLNRIDKAYPGGIPDDMKPLVLRLTKQAPTSKRKLLDGL